MPNLSTAIRTIHADPAWWRKILIGGALWLTVIGWPIVEGHQLESIENSRRGFPTPLPLWTNLLDKAVIGLFALVIDFFYFIFPVLLVGMLFFCGTLILGLSGGEVAARLIATAVPGVVGLYLLFAWIAGVSPVGKQRYVEHGDMPQVLSAGLFRELLQASTRRPYLQARLQSAPCYALALALLTASLWLTRTSGLLGLITAWLGLSALVYARLVVIQLYVSATRSVEQARFKW